MANSAKKTVVSSKTMTDEEKLASIAGLEFQIVEIVGGKKFPKGETFECVKIGLNPWRQPYILISVDGQKSSATRKCKAERP